MKNPFTQSTFKGNKSRVLLLIIAILLVSNTFIIGKKNDGDESSKKLLPPPTPTVVVTLPSGANCYSSLTASGCAVGNTIYWYNNGSYYNTGTTITVNSSTPAYMTAKCYDSGMGFGTASTEYKVFPAGYTELSPKTTQTICSGSSVLFNASSAASGLTYQWRKGFSNISGATGSSYTATATDYYDVVATSGSCTYTSPYVQVVNPTQPFINNSIIGSCGSKMLSLNVYNVSGGTFQWKLNGANISGATASSYSVPVASAAGSYTVDYTSGSCVSTSSAFVFALPTIALTPAVSPACIATLTSTGCSGYTSWFKYNGSSYVFENYTYNSPYTFPVSTIAADYKAMCDYNTTYCADVASNTVTATPTNYTTISPTSTSVCSTGSVLLTANSTFTGITYQWQLGGSNISGATSSTYSATTGGNYSVVVTKGSCSFTSGNAVVTSVTAPTISITSTQSSPATITNGQSLVLTSNGCIANGGTVLWSTSETTSTITVTPSGNSSYTFTCTKTPCVVTSSAFVINVSPLLPPTITSSSPTTCTGTSVTITGTCLGGSTISWNTLPIQTTSVITVSPSTTTTYTATCTSGAVTSNASISIGVFNGAITSLSSGNWTDASTWSCNCIPASCNDVTVEVGHNVMIPPSLTGRLQNLTVKGSVDMKNLSTMKMK